MTDNFMHGLIPIFATPLLVCEFEKHKEYSKRFPTFEKVDRKPETWQIPLNTSFPNVLPDDPYLDNSLIVDLKRDLHIQVEKLLQTYKLPHNIFLPSFWYNASYAGQGQEIHNHLSASNLNPYWSGVYFAKNVTHRSFMFNRSDGGQKTQQPAQYEDSILAPYYEDVEYIPTQKGNDKDDEKIVDGTIILFPPNVYHSVRTPAYNDKDKMRLSFSFNVALNVDLSYHYDAPVGDDSYTMRYHLSHIYKKDLKNE
tara:strand:+ start:1099 stop:1860 length:762 start_codon:yes stop_codon:yes gene_type:complete